MRSLLFYIFLVGLPLLAILEVLEIGNDLKPPIFLGGTWTIERTSNASAASPCGDFLIPGRALLTVSQLGPHLLLTFSGESKATLAGEIDGASVTAKIVDRAGYDEAAIELRARRDRHDGSARLVGTLTFNDCPSRTEVSFVATRRHDGASGDQ
jgi:hypothetical protein